MFKILGSDGKEYGPVTTEQLRQWIREGRAGGQTRVKQEGTGDWTLLSSVPEFADVFRAPQVDSAGAAAMPPVVRIVAFLLLAVACISAIRLLMFFFQLTMNSGNRIPISTGLVFYLSWGVGLISAPARAVCGVGLLFRKEWARRLTIGLSIVLAIFGAWGLVRTGMMFSKIMTDDPQFIFRSPMFLVGQLWSLAVFIFNIATVFILTRKPVRDAFAGKSSVTV